MAKFFVEFTEDKTINYGFYVEAKDKEEAYSLAEERYFNYQDADTEKELFAQTTQHNIEEI